MGFRLVPKSQTLNDLERCNGHRSILHYFAEYAIGFATWFGRQPDLKVDIQNWGLP